MESKNHSAVAGIVQSLKASMPTVRIRDFAPAGKGFARVVAEVVHTGESRKDHSLALTSLNQKLGGKLQAVAGSFTAIEKAPYVDTITGIVAVARKSVAFSEELPQGFRAIAANMYMDEESHMWALKKTEAGNLLVMNTDIGDDDSLVGLLSAVASADTAHGQARMVATASAAPQVEGGNLVTYVNHNNVTRAGIVVATTDEQQAVILPIDGEQELDTVDVAAVAQIINADLPEAELSEQEQMDVQIATASGRIDIQMIVDYYRKVLGYNAEYFKMWSDRIKNHAWA